jgi:hypothetical protein
LACTNPSSALCQATCDALLKWAAGLLARLSTARSHALSHPELDDEELLLVRRGEQLTKLDLQQQESWVLKTLLVTDRFA